MIKWMLLGGEVERGVGTSAEWNHGENESS